MAAEGPVMDQLGLLIDQLSQRETIRAAEATLEQFVAADLTAALVGFARLSNFLPSSDNRAQALLLLKQYLFRANEHGVRAWAVLQSDSQAIIKQELLQALSMGEQRELVERHVACDVAAKIYEAQASAGEPWSQLMEVAGQAISQPSAHSRESGYLIFAALPHALLEYLGTGDGAALKSIVEELIVPPKAGFALIVAYEAACSLLAIWPDGLKPLWGSLFETVCSLSDPDDCESCLQALVDLLSEPDIVEKLAEMGQIQGIISTCSQKATRSGLEADVRRHWIEVGVTMAESSPQLLSKFSASLWSPFITALLQVMSEIEEDPQWLEQEEDNGDTNDPPVVAEAALDRLSQCLEKDVVLPTVLGQLEVLLSSSCWQHIYAGLSAVAVISEGCASGMEAQLKSLLGAIHPFFTYSQPRVRYAALYALAQSCSFLNGAIQVDYTAEALNILINALNDPETRLRAWACSCVVNFFDLAIELDAAPLQLEALFQSLFARLTKDRPSVQVKSMAAIASLAVSCADVPAKHYTSLMPVLLGFLALEEATVSDVQISAVDCAAHVAVAAGTEGVASDAVQLLKLLTRIVDRAESEERPDLQLQTLTAITTTAIVAPEAAVPHLPRLTVALLNTAQQKLDIEADPSDDSDLELVEVEGHTFGVDATKIGHIDGALLALRDLMESMREHMAPYAEQILNTAIPLLKFHFNDEMRKTAAGLMAPVLVVAKAAQTAPEDRHRLFNYIFISLVQAFGLEDSIMLVPAFYEHLADICAEADSCLGSAAAELFIGSLEKQLRLLAARCTLRSQLADPAAEEHGEEADEALLEACSGALRGFIHVQPPADLLDRLTRDLVIEAATAPGPFKEVEASRRWAMRYIIDLIEAQGPQAASLVVNALPLFYTALEADISSAEMRRAAAFGIGSIAQHGGGAYSSFLARCLENLCKACMPKARGADLSDIYARDNAISAVGKILHFAPPNPLLQYDFASLTMIWVKSMPIKLDGAEMEGAYTLLLKLISQNSPAVSLDNSVLASHVAQVLAFALHGDAAEALPPESAPVLRAALSRYVSVLGPSFRSTLPLEVQSLC